MRKDGLIGSRKNPGKVLLADDQIAIHKQIQQNFNELGIPDRLESFKDGKSLIDYIDKLLNKL